MPKIMLINVTHSEESRVGILNNGVLDAFEIESLSREHLKGNIYKGTVHRIHPALEAAFVDIGAERDAFLPLDEICFRNLPSLPPAPTDENGKRRRRIRDLLKPGQEILVQIAKEQFANKPPTLTTFYSLPGRYLVLLPGSDETGISRRIEGDERQRLRKLVEDLDPPDGYGIIVRTAAGLDEDTGELSRDLSYLLRLWNSVQETGQTKRAPALVYREHDIVLRTIRDFFTPDIDEIHVDNEEVFQRARDFLQNVMPGKEHVLRLYRGEQPIFSAFDVEGQIETIFKRRVQLRSGGSIVIDGTEALTAIDVNSGGSVRGPNPEETAFRTNLEAAAEVARQLRLRDIGGLIVVDFIDMRDPRHIQDVERALRDAMRPDKARYESGRISRLGLLEISRQRMRPAAMATTYTSCPMCEGHGAVRTTESAALVALRKIHNRVALGDVASLRIALPPAVALYLLNQKRDDIARLEQRYDSRLHIELKTALMPHQVELEARERAPIERAPVVAPGSVAVADAPAPAAANAAANGNGNGAAPQGEDGKKRRRRRGRRRGSGLRAAAAIGAGLSSLGGGAPESAGAMESTPRAEAQPALAAPPSIPTPTEPPMAARAESAAPAVETGVAPPRAPAAAPGSGRGRRGRRGRRGGSRHRAEAAAITQSGETVARPPQAANGAAEAAPPVPAAVVHTAPPPPAQPAIVQTPVPESAPATPAKRARRAPARSRAAATKGGDAPTGADAPAAETAAPRRRTAARAPAKTAKPRKTSAAAAASAGAAKPAKRAVRKSKKAVQPE